LDDIYDYIDDLDENTSLVVRKQERVNPAAEIYSGSILLGRLHDSRRRGFKAISYERPKTF